MQMSPESWSSVGRGQPAEGGRRRAARDRPGGGVLRTEVETGRTEHQDLAGKHDPRQAQLADWSEPSRTRSADEEQTERQRQRRRPGEAAVMAAILRHPGRREAVSRDQADAVRGPWSRLTATRVRDDR
jgi:hypothetical protein